MRREFFVRWTRSPLRVVAGVEMPSYDRPVPGLLADDLERQLAAVWDALNDPNFTAPTNPDVVEQYLVVAPGSAARLVRGGFTMPPSVATEKPNETHDPQASLVPRAFAVGLNNGHNLLIDLDAFAVRSWWFGDFARQRTQGKTWLWDIAGIPLASDASVPSGFVLVDRREGKSSLVLPQREHATIGTLDGYERHDDGVRLRYRLNLPSGNTLSITETIEPFATNDETGWKREVRVDGVPEGHDVYWVAPRSLAESAGPTHQNLAGTCCKTSGLWRFSDSPLVEPAVCLGRREGFGADTLEFTQNLMRKPWLNRAVGASSQPAPRTLGPATS
jgi:hypothetical protein